MKDNNRRINNKRNSKPRIIKINEITQGEYMLDNKIEELLKVKNGENISPLSGAELAYEPEKWNKKSSIRTTHNCYSYALGKIRPGLESKAQPGYASRHNHIRNEDYNCKEFYNRLKQDSPGVYLQKFDIKCRPGFYKIFLALDPKNDYHWWRQDGKNNVGNWSHKPGATDVTNLDASGKKIKNPLLSDRNFKSLNYHKPCFFACVYSDLSKSLSKIYGNN